MTGDLTTSRNCNAVIYARYSSAGQRDESIEGQIRECTEFAERKGINIVRTYTDKALTATTDKRPGFQRMIADSAKGAFDTVICWKHDRFARNRYDAALYRAKLKNNGVSIIYAREETPDGAQGIIVESVMEGFAEYYSANLAENVKRGMYESALKRYTLGVKVLGLKEGPDKRFVIDENTAPVVRYIFEEYANGKRARDLIDELNAKGFRTSRGQKFSHNSIAQIIQNEKYKGVYRFNDIYDEEAIPPIISRDLWQRANEMCCARAKAPNKSDYEGGYILSGKLFCGECGASMTAGSGTNGHGIVYQYYMCNGRRKHKECDLKAVPKEWAEDAVIDALREIVFSDAIIETFADRFETWQNEQNERLGINALENKLNALERRICALYEAYEEHPELKQTLDRIAEHEKEKEVVLAELNEARFQQPEVTKDEIVFFLRSFRKGDADDPKWRAFIVRTFLDRAFVFGDGHLVLHLNYGNDNKPVTLEKVKEAEAKGETLLSFASSGRPNNVNSNKLLYFRDFFVLMK